MVRSQFLRKSEATFSLVLRLLIPSICDTPRDRMNYPVTWYTFLSRMIFPAHIRHSFLGRMIYLAINIG